MSSSTMSGTSPAPKTRRRRSAGEVVLGVDTHRDAHVAAVLSVMGTVLATDEFPATAAGYRDLLKWARKSGAVRRAGVEGTGSYGASLSRYLLTQDIDVFSSALPSPASSSRKAGSAVMRTALSWLMACVRALTADAFVSLYILAICTGPSPDLARAWARPLNTARAAFWASSGSDLPRRRRSARSIRFARFTDVSSLEEVGEEPVLQATRITLGLLAHRIGQLSEQIRDVDARLAQLVDCHAPQLLEVVGIGPDTAVALLITVGDNPERLDSEASFAALCGVSPVERSSGRRQYRRLNRGGDRQANAALHRIVFTRLRVDPRTQDYYERRIKEGKTRREIVRCLKRYAAREVFHLVRWLQPGPRS
ncbi:transposase [Streptomyces sp. NPDC050564]|uniref:transposase n=1 Tax=Streptomyces sp. NPDC050564 TaxID=3365631 RepID=UPI0037A96901